jgi:hypothetical protein
MNKSRMVGAATVINADSESLCDTLCRELRLKWGAHLAQEITYGEHCLLVGILSPAKTGQPLKD